MTIGYQRIAPGASLLDEDDVLPLVQAWRRQGLRTALVTLVGVEGGAPRQPGAQMAVAEDGRYAGYLSGGCLEQAVALEAKDVIATGANRLVRYGKGSPYFDIRLPCGSGLDLYFDQALGDAALNDLLALRSRRLAASLIMSLGSGASYAVPLQGPLAVSRRDGDTFSRIYPAPIRIALIGNGPAMTGIATLAQVTGLDLLAWSSDEVTRAQLQAAGHRVEVGDEAFDRLAATLDAASAAVVVFHDHEAEPRVLHRLLATPCFYLGVLGNHAVHRDRLAALRALGVAEADLARLHAPVGSIPNAKSKATFAFGVLAQMLAVAKATHLIA
jgi:xanthine dehydrogenase accessory factor